jgi:hypothetical protein
MTSEQETASPHAPLWKPSRGIAMIAFGAQIVLQVAGLLVALLTCIVFSGRWKPYSIFAGAFIFVIMYFITIAIHELGHLLAARSQGMTVMQVRLSVFDLLPSRRGWRIRRGRARFAIAGFVLAYPDPTRPLRKQLMAMVAGGPLANILVAIVSCGIAWLFWPAMSAYPFLALAVLNASTGMLNLMPTAQYLESDGMELLRWWHGIAEDHPYLAYSRLMGLSVSGVTAEKLPADVLAELAKLDMPMPLIVDWLEIKAAQNRGEWSAAARLETSVNARLADQPPAMIRGLADLISSTRYELAFSKAMECRTSAPLIAAQLTTNAQWFMPWLLPRGRALEAALCGDRAACEQLLAESRRHADASLDRALPISEASIRDAILQIARP